jgi:DNA-binding NtrC family response regulator
MNTLKSLSNKAVLIADDDIEQCEELASFLRKKGYFVFTAHDGFTALGMIKSIKPVIVLLDIHMPSMSGDRVSKIATSLDFRTTIILMSGYAELIYDANHSKTGAFAVLDKPLPLKTLDRFLSSLIGGSAP